MESKKKIQNKKRLLNKLQTKITCNAIFLYLFLCIKFNMYIQLNNAKSAARSSTFSKLNKNNNQFHILLLYCSFFLV